MKLVNLAEKEQLKPEFLKINPQHTVPTIDDNGFILWESRAILAYLVSKYGKPDETLYPNCPKARATIDQRLYFDAATMYKEIWPFFAHFTRNLPLPEDAPQKVDSALGFLDSFLQDSKWVAGDGMTIADFSLVASVSSLEAFDHQMISFKNVIRWLNNCKTQMPGYAELNDKGVKMAADSWKMKRASL